MPVDCGCEFWKRVAGGLIICRCGQNTLTIEEYENFLKEKLSPAHEHVIEMLKEDPKKYLIPFAELYLLGVDVPKADLPRLAKAFRDALSEVTKGASQEEYSELIDSIYGITTVLLNQVNR